MRVQTSDLSLLWASLARSRAIPEVEDLRFSRTEMASGVL